MHSIIDQSEWAEEPGKWLGEVQLGAGRGDLVGEQGRDRVRHPVPARHQLPLCAELPNC